MPSNIYGLASVSMLAVAMFITLHAQELKPTAIVEGRVTPGEYVELD